jgi:hypothetical protein
VAVVTGEGTTAGVRGKQLIKVRHLTGMTVRPPDGVITPAGTMRARRVIGAGLAGLLHLAACSSQPGGARWVRRTYYGADR